MFPTAPRDEGVGACKETSQSPQVGSMFPTVEKNWEDMTIVIKGRNPLKSGQCFLPLKNNEWERKATSKLSQSPQVGSMFPTKTSTSYRRWALRFTCRNPLKSGQCFLPRCSMKITIEEEKVAIPSSRVNVSYSETLNFTIGTFQPSVAIPSSRVNVSYLQAVTARMLARPFRGRNPLKSGQCFLLNGNARPKAN